MYHSFLIHSSADGHLGRFHVLAIINSAAMNPHTARKRHNKENSTNCQNTERTPQTQQFKQDEETEE